MFQEKLCSILKELHNGIFGNHKVRSRSIEFQKRGPPHTHVLIWIENFNLTPTEIDKIICAEIPPENSPLHEKVMRLMVHGPCGSLNPQAKCMKNGVCTKGYPKPYMEATTFVDDDYPSYRRRSPEHGGRTFTKMHKGTPWRVTNANIIPYSPYFVQKYNCHVNLECCASIKSMKYIFKCEFKGNDMAIIAFDEIVDETTIYQNKRYISSCEAYWRFAEYPLVELKPSVLQLPVHFQNLQTLVHEPNSESAQTAAENQERTMLTEYFANNAKTGETLKCEEYPVKYRWDYELRKWVLRARQLGFPEQIGNMIRVHPSQGEKFYFRLLLKNVGGATSY